MNAGSNSARFLPILGGAIAFSTWVTLATPTPATPQAPNLAAPTTDTAPAMLDFSEAESDFCVALYGCDCHGCLNALRELRGLPPLHL
ncbi:hypothetical protein GlitD10_1583 [Gloeomargarita lithophora Alchichica-D10]|uniref:Uncharacterized protein n=1 Tax=Gloeomargarita lithophora Alchichica-D10 TaxID=1188229 RepID=A0A1J0ADB4_9CYAN|nr:hypothetical protein [Gloeomargarita lithophora]APB33907.1 hypothetical protein GlitD10_1583 [Gloeomargarita lithophora Alchichica-D10]